jgi:threonine synthase
VTCFVTHLECANCQTRYEANAVHGLCTRCQKPLWVRYDLAAIRSKLRREQLRERPSTMWRYRELSPVMDDAKIVSLGETMTPLLPAPQLAAHLGVQHLYVKDESRLPTGSFKARGMAMAVTKAHEFGITCVAAPTAGNAGGAMSAYAARAGMQSYVFMPEDTPSINVKECWLNGAKAFRVNGLIDDCGRIVGAGKSIKGWFDLSTLKEPYRIEGKKTMGLELAEQLGWELPDVIFYPTGGGTGLIGMWKAFDELEALGWLHSSKRPRMISCQSDGCAPIAAAFERGERFAKRVENAATIASGVRVPAAVGDFMILDAVRASGGIALSVPESSIRPWMRQANTLEGLPICPETAVCFAALEMMLARGQIKPHEKIIVFNTAAVQKYPEAIEEQIPQIDIRQPIDWESI